MSASDGGRPGQKDLHLGEGTVVHTEYGIELCRVVEWIEDGLHVVSAVDFDLVAVGATEHEAINNFASEARSLVDSIQGLIERDEATKEEAELYIRLAQPFLKVIERELEDLRRKQRRREKRLIDFPRLRRGRGEHNLGWRTASSHGNLKRPSLV
jgi:hypothetical protein